MLNKTLHPPHNCLSYLHYWFHRRFVWPCSGELASWNSVQPYSNCCSSACRHQWLTFVLGAPAVSLLLQEDQEDNYHHVCCCLLIRSHCYVHKYIFKKSLGHSTWRSYLCCLKCVSVPLTSPSNAWVTMIYLILFESQWIIASQIQPHLTCCG